MNLNGVTFKGMFAESPLWKKVILFIFLLIFFTCLFSGIGLLVTKIAGWDGRSAEAMKVIQLCSSTGVFILTPIVYIFFTRTDPKGFFRLKMVDPRIIFLGLLSIIVAYPFISVVGILNEGMHLPDVFQGVEDWMKKSEEDAKWLTLLFLDTHTIPGLISNLIVVALVPAIGEELMFRGVLQQSLAQKLKNEHVAVWVAAFVFSAIHLQFFGFFPRLLLGVLLGYLFVYGKSLIIPIFCHFMNNAVTIIYAYTASPEKALETDMKATPGMVTISIILLGITCLILLRIQHLSKKQEEREEI